DVHGVEHVQGGFHDLRANAVATDDRNRLGHLLVPNGRHGARAPCEGGVGRPLCQTARYGPGVQPWSWAGAAGAPSPASSRSRKPTARRRCGITIDPPTTSPMENASNISSRPTPASLHWATW